MLAYPYPVNLIDEYDGTVLVTSPDFPELTTFGAVRAAPLAHAVGTSEEAIASRIHGRMDVPAPTAPRRVIVPRNADGRESDALPGMRDAHVSKSELARRLNWHFRPSIACFDLNHRSRLDPIDAALAAVGLRSDVGVVAIRSVTGPDSRSGRPLTDRVDQRVPDPALLHARRTDLRKPSAPWLVSPQVKCLAAAWSHEAQTSLAGSSIGYNRTRTDVPTDQSFPTKCLQHDPSRKR